LHQEGWECQMQQLVETQCVCIEEMPFACSIISLLFIL